MHVGKLPSKLHLTPTDSNHTTAMGLAIVLALNITSVTSCGVVGVRHVGSAEDQVQELEADQGLSAAPPGAQLVEQSSSEFCGNPGFDDYPPYVLWRYRTAEVTSEPITFMQRALSNAGWIVDSHPSSTSGRTSFSFSRDFAAFEARGMVSSRHGSLSVRAEIASPSFC